jgi:adenine-specific DNA-methyltransferase
MLNNSGILGYISPSSFFNSVAGGAMRAYLTANKNIKAIVDLKHFQPFSATTYTTIAVLTKQPQEFVQYYEYDTEKLAPEWAAQLRQEDFNLNNSYVFGREPELKLLRHIYSAAYGMNKFVVKNGFATLCDDFYIGDWSFEEYAIPVIKASTGKKYNCIFPYDECGNTLPFDKLAAKPKLKAHFEHNRERLQARSIEKRGEWYTFGRSQGINNVYKKKYAINTLIRDERDIKLSLCPAGTGIFGGFYILTECDIGELKALLYTEEFTRYIRLLGKYKSGGYYTYSSKELQRYLNFKYAKKGEESYE